MDVKRSEIDPTLIDDVRRIWDAKADFWDARMADGNEFERILVGPAIERLLAIQPGERVLDVACGTGVGSRRLARLGARVVAVDVSERMLEHARARTTEQAGEIDYRLVDATNQPQVLALGEGAFDAVVCSMALMDMPAIDPLLHAAARLLTARGRFVFTVLHPAFNNIAVNRCAEIETTADGREVAVHGVKVLDYLTVPTGKGTAMLGEPQPHWYFHRPLQTLLGACFDAGFVLDGLEEPAFPRSGATGQTLGWSDVPGIPPVLAARLVRRRTVEAT
jgi:2-polyprenyl-3-methyl-5-hydroxy-6-metoxy-1,4-benzoquinol methylase